MMMWCWDCDPLWSAQVSSHGVMTNHCLSSPLNKKMRPHFRLHKLGLGLPPTEIDKCCLITNQTTYNSFTWYCVNIITVSDTCDTHGVRYSETWPLLPVPLPMSRRCQAEYQETGHHLSRVTRIMITSNIPSGHFSQTCNYFLLSSLSNDLSSTQ